jgi:hypothetical protein
MAALVYASVMVRCCLPDSECTAIFCVAAISKAIECAVLVVLVTRFAVVEPGALQVVGGGALVGGKVSTQGRRGRTLVVRECRQPAAAWELSSASSNIATSLTSTLNPFSIHPSRPLPATCHSPWCRRSTGIPLCCMSAPAQTVQHGITDELSSWWILLPITVVMVRCSHRYFLHDSLTCFIDPDRYPPPLRNDAPPNHTQEARPPQNPATTLPRPRRQSPLQRQCALSRVLPGSQVVHGPGLPGRQVSSGPGVEGQAETESHERSCGDGGHDGHDEG